MFALFLAPLPFLGCHVLKLLLWHPVLAPVTFLGCRVHVLLLLLLLLLFAGCCAFWRRCLFRCCCTLIALPVPPTSAIRPSSLAPTSAIRPSSLAPLSNPPPWILALPVPPTSAIRPSSLAPLSNPVFFPTARANPADHCHGLSRSPVNPSACSGSRATTATRNMHGVLFFL